MVRLSVFVMLMASLAIVSADVYLHHPRGQNDRCDEKSNDRNNNKRCWDSENNSAGGYATSDGMMKYYEGTVLDIAYYSQHACGNGAMANSPDNQLAVTCQHVIQLGCEDQFKKFLAPWEVDSYQLTDGISLGRPGADEYNTYDDESEMYNTFGSTCTQTRPTRNDCENFDYNQCATQCNTDLSNSGNRNTFNSDTCECCPRKLQTYCYHEPEGFYEMCKSRERNKGLFAADENVNNNGGATKTRQEPNSARYGFECTEERDYWPYWHPSPWMDLAVQMSDTSTCQDYVLSRSQNQRTYCLCRPEDNEGSTWEQKMQAVQFNQERPCLTQTFPDSDSSEDLGFNTVWDCDSYVIHDDTIGAPDCILAEHQIDNRLGSATCTGDTAEESNGGRDLTSYKWTIPYGFSGESGERKCVIRLRYNISTAETLYDFDDTDNEILEENPVFTYGDGYEGDESTAPPVPTSEDGVPAQENQYMPLRMAINTAQFGRTFEDRTYVLTFMKRPPELEGYTIHNLGVRGKRGNIAQVRNCLEYDYHPTYLGVGAGDKIHFQWALSDYNNNGNAGEGRQGTDRVNLVAVENYHSNQVYPTNRTEQIFDTDALNRLAWLDQKESNCYSTNEMLKNKKNSGNDPQSCHFLNGARNDGDKPTAYFNMIADVKRVGVFNFMCSRNNNFTNRSQKGTIDSGASTLSGGAIAGIVVGSIVGVAALAGVGFLGFQKYGGATKV